MAKVIYEWWVSDGQGQIDIYENFTDIPEHVRTWPDDHDIELVRDVPCAVLAEEDERGYASLTSNGLPATFDNTRKVPKRFLTAHGTQ